MRFIDAVKLAEKTDYQIYNEKDINDNTYFFWCNKHLIVNTGIPNLNIIIPRPWQYDKRIRQFINRDGYSLYKFDKTIWKWVKVME